MKHFAGKTVLITDFDPNIGAEVAERLLQAGASILVTGFRVAEIILNRFEGRQGITDTGIHELTTEKLPELVSRIEQDHGGLDAIFTNNYVNPELDADSILEMRVAGMVFILQRLHPLVYDGGTIVVCASFPPEQREKSRFLIEASAAIMRSFAQTWALELEVRRIRVNVASLYKPESDHAIDSEEFILSSSHQPAKGQTRPNTLKEVASAIVDLALDDCSLNGIELVVVDGNAQETQLPYSAESNLLGSSAQIVDNVVFLASDVSRPLTGMQLFPEGEIRKL